jgi:hypothetical protein
MDKDTEDRIALVRALVDQPGNTNTSSVQINAGGVGIWIAITACLIMLAVTMVGSIFIAIALSDLNRQTQELREADVVLQAYINAGYVSQPKEEAP